MSSIFCCEKGLFQTFIQNLNKKKIQEKVELLMIMMILYLHISSASKQTMLSLDHSSRTVKRIKCIAMLGFASTSDFDCSVLYLHYREDRVLQSDWVDTSLPLRHRGVDVDGPWLRSQPHGRQDWRHLLHLAVGNLVLSAGLAHAVLDVGAGLLHKPPVHGVCVLAVDLVRAWNMGPSIVISRLALHYTRYNNRYRYIETI